MTDLTVYETWNVRLEITHPTPRTRMVNAALRAPMLAKIPTPEEIPLSDPMISDAIADAFKAVIRQEVRKALGVDHE